MKSTILGLVALLGVFVMTASAADPTGKWTAEVPGRQGNTMTTTFDLKASGGALTGTVGTQRGETPIENGKVDGDNISFTTTMKFNDMEIKLTYKGVIKSDAIDFTRERDGGGGQGPGPQKFTAKKSST
jgi:hypothetical protein